MMFFSTVYYHKISKIETEELNANDAILKYAVFKIIYLKLH